MYNPLTCNDVYGPLTCNSMCDSMDCAGLVGLSLAYALPITDRLNGLLTVSAETEQEMVAVERLAEYTHLPPQPSTLTPHNLAVTDLTDLPFQSKHTCLGISLHTASVQGAWFKLQRCKP